MNAAIVIRDIGAPFAADDAFIVGRAGQTIARPSADCLVHPQIDMYETAEFIIIEAALPGTTGHDVEVTFDAGSLRLSGSTGGEQQDRRWHRREIAAGRFDELISLPAPVTVDGSVAAFADGILTILAPKAIRLTGTTISIRRVVEEAAD